MIRPACYDNPMIFFLCKLFAFPYFLHDSICFKQMRSVQTPFFTFKIPFAVLFYKNTFNVLNLYEKKKFLINHTYNNIWKVKNDLFYRLISSAQYKKNPLQILMSKEKFKKYIARRIGFSEGDLFACLNSSKQILPFENCQFL